MTRRMQHYDVAEWRPWLLVAAFGALVILAGIVCLIVQLVVSIRQRESLRDLTGDPWNGRNLEWSTSSPPPPFNFPVLPQVHGQEAYWSMKEQARARHRLADKPHYESIEVPRNSPTGFVCAFFATITGFALIWYIWWLAIAGSVGAVITFLVFAWRQRAEDEIPAERVAEIDAAIRHDRSLELEGQTA